MYEFAYNDVIEDSHRTLRARERAAMDRVIGMLRAAQETGPQSRERIDALFYLRRLWMIFIDDLNDPTNQLPAQLRAGIVSIGAWMMKEIDRVRGGLTNDLTPMIEINELIRDGLKGGHRGHEHHAQGRGTVLHQRRGHPHRPEGLDR